MTYTTTQARSHKTIFWLSFFFFLTLTSLRANEREPITGPPPTIEGEPAEYVKLRGDQGWRITSKKHKNKIVQEDGTQHGWKRYKLLDKKGKRVIKSLDINGNDREAEEEEEARNSNSKKKEKKSRGKKKYVGKKDEEKGSQERFPRDQRNGSQEWFPFPRDQRNGSQEWFPFPRDQRNGSQECLSEDQKNNLAWQFFVVCSLYKLYELCISHPIIVSTVCFAALAAICARKA